jgi:hypothetical protein
MTRNPAHFAEIRVLCRKTVTSFGYVAQIETVQSNLEHIGFQIIY